MKQLLIFFLSLFLPSFAGAQTLVETRLDTASILIGEQVQLEVKCTAPARSQVSFPNYAQGEMLTPGVEVVYNGPVDTLKLNDGKRLTLRRKYTITSFDSALYTLPPFRVEVDGKPCLSASKIGLKVSTVAVDTVHVDKFNGPHGAVDLPFEWTPRQTLCALLAMLLGFVAWLLAVRLSDPRMITRRVVVHPPTPPHVVALDAMQTIKSQPPTDPKSYYMELTETLRSYIEKRFGFAAREMTTTEIIDELTSADHADALEELRGILQTADLVKFAKFTPSLSDQDRSFAEALNYVQATKLEPAEPPKPHIEYVGLSDAKGRAVRTSMRWTALVFTAAAIALTAYVIYDVYACFG